MILPGTPYDTIYRTLVQENEKVEFALRKFFQNKIKKTILKGREAKECYYETYTVPKSRNNYLLCVSRAKGRPGFVPLGYLVVQDFSNRVFFLLIDAPNVKMVVQYDSHFLRRYRERVLKNEQVPTEHVLCDFQAAGMDFSSIDSDRVLLNKEKYGEFNCMAAMDGHLIAIDFYKLSAEDTKLSKDLGIMRLKTIISNEMLKPNQSEAVNEIVNIKRLLNPVHLTL